MKTALTPGRWRGLKMTSTDRQKFTIVAFDQRGTYRKMLPADTPYEMAASIKSEVVTALSRQASAILLDPQYGLQASVAMHGTCGLLLAYENTGYAGESTARRISFDPDWTIAKIKRFGASAAKMLVYYHPDSGALADELDDVIRSAADECHRLDLPLFLEPLSYSLDANIAKESPEFAQRRPQIVIETARRLSQLGVDVLKLEFPLDAAYNRDPAEWRTACQAISDASRVPWVLLSAGVDFETFEMQTQIACEAGASGFLAGRAIWKESITMSAADRADFLATTAASRMRRLIDIATSSARPWTDFYAPPDIKAEWWKTYPNL